MDPSRPNLSQDSVGVGDEELMAPASDETSDEKNEGIKKFSSWNTSALLRGSSTGE